MSGPPTEVRFKLKAVINKQKTKVLFAEVDDEFAVIMLSFLILPLGRIVYALEKHYGDSGPHVFGSLNTLHHGLANLKTITKFKFDSVGPPWSKIGYAYPFPFVDMNLQPHLLNSGLIAEAYFVALRIFHDEKATFVLSDDLGILPNGHASTLQMLKHLGVDMAEIDGAETRNVTFGLNETMDFLRGMLTSRQPLTDIILAKSEEQSCDLKLKFEPGTPLTLDKEEATDDSASKIYNLKVMYQKSTSKILFAHVDKDFATYVANMITFPLGLVDSQLGGNTCFNKLEHLYRSLVDLIDHMSFEDKVCAKLKKPENFYYSEFFNAKKSRTYVVTDDLTITRLYLSSILSLFNEMNISFTDVEEVELKIGLEEARNILKASLTSTCALTDGLNNPEFMKLLKQKQEL